jgi:ATP-dependent helicase/nuclease subunit A
VSTPPDQKERDAICNDLDVTMLVEAAAGTGKTTNLVKRMVNVVRTGRATPSTLAAITFTVKAAAHLREEFQRALPGPTVPSPRASGEKVAEGRMRGDEEHPHPAFGHPLPQAGEGTVAAFIGTTHAFCARLLRERPVEAGLDPEFEELDEVATRLITSEFWNRWYDSHDVSAAREVGLDRKTLRHAFERIAEHPDVKLVWTPRERPNLGNAMSALLRFLDRCEPLVPNHEDPDKFEKRMKRLLRLRTSLDLSDPFNSFVILDEANHASDLPTQKRWGKEVAKDLGPAYESLVLNTIRPALQHWREHVHAIAIELLHPATVEFAAERRRNGTLTFQDLLVCARDLLRDHPNVRRYFQKRFTHVFVDEFQDTDPVQAEVLMYLTGEDVDEKNWRKARPKPGSLFIVGDPKQSIYRFRRADITTYLEVKKIIESSGGRVVPLWTNFRSVPAICAYVNEVFPTLFKQDDVEAGRQASHVDLVSERDGASQPAGVFSLETAEMRPFDMACAEAEAVGRWIEEKVASRAIDWSDVLLVSWQRPRLRCYAATFERLGIPYEVTGSKAFGERDVLESAMPLLRAVVTPEDEVAIVAFLRGPLCGVDDDALYRFRRAGGRFSPFAKQLEETDARIVDGFRIINAGIEDARQHPPAATIARLFDRVGLLAMTVSGERPGTRTGNLLLALTIAREASSRGETLGAIIDELQDLVEEPPEIDELDVDPSRVNAVRLMNLHQVKGLEAPVVFLVDPADEFDFPVDLFVDRRGEESVGYLAVTRAWGGYGRKFLGQPPGWDQFNTIENSFKRAEKMRLLYVAATRAKNMLVVGFRTTRRGPGGAWRDLASRIRDRFAVIPSRAAQRAVARQQAATIAVEQIVAKFEHARETSYDVTPITKIAHASHADLVKAEEGLGKGTSWGRVLHRLFEAMLRDESLDVRLYARNLLKDEERDPVELDEVMRVVDAVRGSSLWTRVKKADERYVEIPFALTVDDSLLHGTIDLVFREGGEWFIVDYKSDSTKGRIDSLVEYYKPQVEHYARFWSQLTNAPASAGLFFVDGLIERWI